MCAELEKWSLEERQEGRQEAYRQGAEKAKAGLRRC